MEKECDLEHWETRYNHFSHHLVFLLFRPTILSSPGHTEFIRLRMTASTHNNRLHTNTYTFTHKLKAQMRSTRCVFCVRWQWRWRRRIELWWASGRERERQKRHGIEANQMVFMQFSWTHKCRHHHLCYNVTHHPFSLHPSFSLGLFAILVNFLSLTHPFSVEFNFLTCVRTNKKQNKLSGIITRFHLLTAHSIQFLANP